MCLLCYPRQMLYFLYVIILYCVLLPNKQIQIQNQALRRIIILLLDYIALFIVHYVSLTSNS